MILKIIDNWGHKGVIREDFSVEYTGPEPVEQYVDTVVAEASSETEATQELLISINSNLAIQEIRKVDE